MMRIISKKRALRLTALCGVSLLVATATAPGAVASNGGDVTVGNTETVSVYMDASGKINAKRVYEQLSLSGKGKVDIGNPVSTKGLRNLQGFSKYDVKDGQVRIKTDVDGNKKYRSVSTFTKQLPLEINVGYFLDGKKMKPEDIVGKSGNLEVRYRVTNVTGQPQDVAYTDGKGNEKTSPESVVIPMVGSLTTNLPGNFTKIRSNEANAAGDGKGNTSLSFTMTLIPPIGKNYADFGYTAKVKDAKIPKASITALPVDPLVSPSFKSAAESYEGGAQTGTDLAEGATEIDNNLLKLRDGAAELVDGLLKIAEGAGLLSAGLNNEAAPGANKLAAGANQLSAGTGKLDAGATKLNAGGQQLKAGTSELNTGAKKLDVGANTLADGLETAAAGGPALIAGVEQLLAGAEQVDAGLVQLAGAVNAGIGTPSTSPATTLRGGVAAILAGVTGPGGLTDQIQGAINTLGSAVGDIDTAIALVNAEPVMVDKPGVLTALGTAKAKVNGVIAGLTAGKASIESTGPTGLVGGLNGLDAGLASLNTQVQNGVGTPSAPGTLRNGMGQLITGLETLLSKGQELADGLVLLSEGADTLADGTGTLQAGTAKLNTGAGTLAAGIGDLKVGTAQLDTGAGTLAAGAGQLALGLGDAASGAAELAAGTAKAAESAPALPKGADRLSKEGTSKLIEAGDQTASDYGLKYALIAAGSDRAANALPYGAPEGATGKAAYKFELAASEEAGSANKKRGILAAALLAGVAGIAVARRKGMI